MMDILDDFKAALERGNVLRVPGQSRADRNEVDQVLIALDKAIKEIERLREQVAGGEK